MTALRSEEDFVIRAVAAFYSGEWWPGENPPDAYLKVNGATVAVEISTLMQHVPDEKGGSKARLSEDATAMGLVEELSNDLRDDVPDGRTVLLILESPISQARKVKGLLANRIRECVSESSVAAVDVEEEFIGNRILIRVMPCDEPDSAKVHAAITNRKSSPDILLNARYILEERITVKSVKCRSLQGKSPLWLALLNDYFIADDDTYKQAFRLLYVIHPFAKILLVSGGRSVVPLYELGHTKP